MMRRIVIAAFALLAASCTQPSKSVVILSTNDMHAQIERMPKLATAIKMCRDTAEVILLDGRDRWTGNPFVDLAEGHRPIYELMNSLDYDFAIYGNHEFDKGQAELAVSNRASTFDFICANIKSDTTTFPQPAPYKIVERGGHKIAFVGVVGNDSNGHPSGQDSSYKGLTFETPGVSAAKYRGAGDDASALILVAHMGYDRDKEFASSDLSQGYDQIIGAHSHDVVDEVCNGIQLSQTGSRLKNIGVTTLSFDGRKLSKIEYDNIPLDNYSPDPETEAMVKEYRNIPELQVAVGQAKEPLGRQTLRNIFAEVVREAADAEIGLYHNGGVRMDSVEEGDITIATIFHLEPFQGVVATVELTRNDLRQIIIEKYNDASNLDEARMIDITATVPYTIVTDESGKALDVVFPTLRDGHKYKVAAGDYMCKTYSYLRNIPYTPSETQITTALTDYITRNSPLENSSESLQKIEQR